MCPAILIGIIPEILTSLFQPLSFMMPSRCISLICIFRQIKSGDNQSYIFEWKCQHIASFGSLISVIQECDDIFAINMTDSLLWMTTTAMSFKEEMPHLVKLEGENGDPRTHFLCVSSYVQADIYFRPLFLVPGKYRKL